MAIRIKRYAIVLIIFTTMVNATCLKKIDCTQSYNSFVLKMRAYPDTDSIAVGDTLWLELNEPTKLKDITTNQEVDYSGAANLGNVIGFLKFVPGINDSYGAVSNFKVITFEGQPGGNTINPLIDKEFLFKESNGFYKLKLAIIPLDTGRYVLNISNAANVYRRNDNCTKASFQINFDSTNQHFFYLQQWRPDLILDNVGKKKVFYFKVVY